MADSSPEDLDPDRNGEIGDSCSEGGFENPPGCAGEPRDYASDGGDDGCSLHGGDDGCLAPTSPGDLFSSSEEANSPLARAAASGSPTSATSDRGGTANGMRLLWDLEESCRQELPELPRLARLLASARVFREEDPRRTSVEEDREWIADYYDLPDDDDTDGSDTHPWVLRLEFNSDELRGAGIQVLSIRRMLLGSTGPKLHIIYSDLPATSCSQFLRIRTRVSVSGYEARAFLLLLSLHILDLPIQAFSDFPQPFKRSRVSSEASTVSESESQTSVSAKALKAIRLEFDAFRQDSGCLSSRQQRDELFSFKARMLECLANHPKEGLVQANAASADNLLNLPMQEGLLLQESNSLGHQCCADLLMSTDDTVQSMCAHSADDQRQHRLIIQLLKKEWMKRFSVAELEDCIAVIDGVVDRGFALAN